MDHRGETLTSHNIPEVDEAVSPSGGQEAATGAKTNSIDLGKVGILRGKGRLVPLALTKRTSLHTQALTRTPAHIGSQQPCSSLPLHFPTVPCPAS